MTLQKTLAIAIAVAAICCFTVSAPLVATTVPDTAPIITYTASGIFASAPNGADTLQLAGEPFSVTISASAATVPYKLGRNWAAYHQLKLTGSVHTRLVPGTPVKIASSQASIIQALNPGQYDQFTMEAPIRIAGINLTIQAVIKMPWGTIPKMLLYPFKAPVAMTSSNATLTYSDAANSTVLAIQSGTLTATIPQAPQAALPLLLHSGGAQAVTLHSDGTATERSIGMAPVDLGGSTDAVTLKFYASGLSNASEVHMQIAGEDVPVLYSGTSGYFPGLDEVTVQVPRSLAGRGDTDVTLTADGHTADPIHIYIQ